MAQVIKIEIPVTVLDETDALSGIISKLQELDKVAKKVSKIMGSAGKMSAFEMGKTDALSRTTSKLQELDRTAKSVSKTIESTGSASGLDKTDALSRTTSKLEEMDRAAKSVSKTMESTESAFELDKTDALSEIISKMQEFDKAAKSVSKTMESTGKMPTFEKAYQKAIKPMMEWGSKTYRSVMEVKDAASPIISKITAKAKGMAGKAWGITLKAKDLATAPIRGVLDLLKNPLLQAGAVLGVSVGFKDTVDTYSNFEAAMSQVKAISGASGTEFDQLTAKAKEMGASTKFTATESAEAFNYMAMAGWKTKDMLDGIGGIMSLAAASNEDLGTTSDIVTDALTAFGMKSSDAGHFADVLAQAASSANTDVGMMGETFKYAGSMAGALGYSIEDVSLAAGLMANTGLKAGMAGTSLNSIFTRLSTNTDGAADAIRELGVEFFNADGSARKWSNVMSELRTATADYSSEQKTNLANTVAGMEAQKGLLAILNATEEDYNKIAEAVNNADGASQRMADTVQDNLAGAMTRLQSAADGVKLSLGERLKPYLTDLAEWLTDKMPDIEDGLMRFMDRVDSAVESVKGKIAGFTATAEWQDADFFGKVKIAWDEIVAEPFSEWWEGSGRIQMAGVAKDIGTGLGTGLSAGILTLLGIDVSSTVDDAKMVGRQFADGFREGFQGVDFGEIFGSALSGMASNAAKFIPGGESPDITSALSAMALFKMAQPVIGIGSGAFKIGKGIYNSATGGLLHSAIGSFSVADELAGVGNVSGTGLMGLFGKAGLALGSGATTAGGLALAGGASIAGGLVGAGTVLSAGKNIYTAVTTDDNNERAANIGSAGLKLTGVGTGAAIGAMFGGPVGALIGAGIGGFAGLLAGGKVEENYQRQAEEAAKAAEAAEILGEKSKYAIEGAKFESKELQKAFEDSEVSVEEFASQMEKATSDKIRNSFGDIKLSMKEIKEIASDIVLGSNAEAVSEFSKAASTAESSMQALSDSASGMKKLNWKASLGVQFDEAGIEEYMSGIDSLINSASQYISDNQYEVKTAVDLLVEPGNETDMFTGMNAMYAEMQGRLESLGGDLKAKVKVHLEDGIIDVDEQAELDHLQSQITDITNMFAEAQGNAKLEAIKLKYSGADLTAESYSSLHSELQAKAQEMADTYQEAFVSASTELGVESKTLKMKFEAGEISESDFASAQESIQQRMDALSEGYQMNLKDISVNVGSFELDTIADMFEENLDGILPDLEGSVTQRLAQAMNKAAEAGVDMTSWSSGNGEGLASAVKWLGLDGLDTEVQSAVAQMMGNLAEALPDQMGQLEDIGSMFNDMFTSGVESADLSGAAQTAAEKLGEGLGEIELPEDGSGFQKGIEGMAVKAVEELDLSNAFSGFNGKFNEAFESIETIDASGLKDAMSTSISSAVEGLEYGAVTAAVGSGISEAILAAIGEIEAAINSLYSQVGAAINSAFSAGFQTTTTVTITADYQLANPSATISFSGGGSGTATVSASISGHAGGGYVGGRQLSWLAEEGYGEFVIPTAPHRRARALELYEQAGRMLGVGAHAEGGFVGSVSTPYSVQNAAGINYIDGTRKYAPMGGIEATGDNNYYYSSIKEAGGGSTGQSDYYYSPDTAGGDKEDTSGSMPPVQVNVNMNPEIHISGNDVQDEEDIRRILRKLMKEMSDELTGVIAANLEEVFSNMPLKVGVC